MNKNSTVGFLLFSLYALTAVLKAAELESVNALGSHVVPSDRFWFQEHYV